QPTRTTRSPRLPVVSACRRGAQLPGDAGGSRPALRLDWSTPTCRMVRDEDSGDTTAAGCRRRGRACGASAHTSRGKELLVLCAAVFAERRDQMVETQLIGRGLQDQAVLTAMRTVPREAFVPAELRAWAYEDMPLPIGDRQTISQPYIVAAMTAALQLTPDARVLEIGPGSGDAAAVLSCLAQRVDTVERLETWVRHAGQCLQRLGYHNVCLHHADGTLGWPAGAPYQGIVVAAGGPTIPAALQEQLALGGRLVIPVGAHQRRQQLLRVTGGGATPSPQEALGAVCFVPLIGAQGWPARAGRARLPRRAPRQRPGGRPRATRRMMPPQSVGQHPDRNRPRPG